MNTFLDAALTLHDKGFSVIPLMPKDKLPNGKVLPLDAEGKATWKPFQTERATREQIVQWWTNSPDSNIGIATGKVSGCIVVDIDSEEGAANLREHGKMPRTPTSKTGKGWHSIIRHTTSGNRHELVPGVDIRGDGGYIVAPPSIHPSGRVYRWLVSPDECELAEAPDWLVKLLKPKERPTYVRPTIRRDPNDVGLRAWAHVGLVNISNELAAVISGRNETLYDKSIRLGSIVAHGLLTEMECLSALEGAMYANGYIQEHKAGSFEATFHNGFEFGLTVPCDLPDPERPRISLNLTSEPTWDSLPVVVRGQINANISPSSAPTLETIIEGEGKKHLDKDEIIDVERLFDVSSKLGRGLSKKTIRNGLKKGSDPHGIEFVTLFAPIDSDTSKIESSTVIDTHHEKVKNPLGGRPSDRYKMLPLSRIIDNLISFLMTPLIKKMFPIKSALVAPVLADFLEDLNRPEAESTADAIMSEYGKLIEDQEGYKEAYRRARKQYNDIVGMLRHPEFAPLPDGPYRNTPEYMTKCAQAIMISKGGETQYSLSEWSIRLGCTNQNVNNVLRRSNIEVESGQYADRVVTHIGQIKGLKTWWDKEMLGKPKKVISSMARGSVGVDNPNLVSWCEGELAKGAALSIRYTQANKQFYPPRTPDVEDTPKDEVPPKLETPILIDAPVVKKPKRDKPKQKRETWREANERKLVQLVAKSKNIPVQVDGKRVTNGITGEVQLSLDFLLNRNTEPAKLDEIDSQATADLIVWMVNDLGGTVSAVHEAGSAEYAKLAS